MENTKKYGGKVYFIDRNNVNTDELIPAKYLTYIEKEPLKPHLLEDLKLDGYNPDEVNWEEYGIIVSRSNFGTGSSREAAPWALEVNGINVIIASNIARIFRENAFNVGMLALEVGVEKINELFIKYKNLDEVFAEVNIDERKITFSSTYNTMIHSIEFTLNKFQADLVQAGGWLKLADEKY